MTNPDQPGAFRELASEAQVNSRIDEMAATIIERYQGLNPLFVCFLKGAVPFTARLMSSIASQDPTFHPQVDFMTISTYGTGREAREPRIVMDLAPNVQIADRVVVMLDDVLDTGTTADHAKKHFFNLGAAAVDLAVLVQKNNERPLYPRAAFFGFESPAHEWLTGMGMDDAKQAVEANRWMGSIVIVNH